MKSTDQGTRKNRKRAVALALVGVGIVGLGSAAASSLTVNTKGYADVAAGAQTVSVAGSCLDTVDVAFTPQLTATAPAGGVVPVAAAISNMKLGAAAAACTGQQLTMTVYNSKGAQIATDSWTVDATGTHTFTPAGLSTSTLDNGSNVAIVVAPAA